MNTYEKPNMSIKIFNNKNINMATDESNVNPANLGKVNDYFSVNNKLNLNY